MTHCASQDADATTAACLALETGTVKSDAVAACARVVKPTPTTEPKAAVDALAKKISQGSTVFGPVAHEKVARTLAACSCAAQFATGAACGLDAVSWVLAAADAATRASLAALDRRHLVEAACSRIAAVEARCCRALGRCARAVPTLTSGEGWACDVAALACRGRVGDAPATQAVLSGEHAGALHWRPPSSLQEAWRESVTEALAAPTIPAAEFVNEDKRRFNVAVANAVAASRRDASLLPLALLASHWSGPPPTSPTRSREKR